MKSERSRHSKGSTARVKQSLAERRKEKRYILRLYVSGMTPRSMRAIATLKTVCEEHLAGCHDLEVINIQEHPTLAKRDQVIATPTLIKRLPPPLHRLVGDLSSAERVLLSLDLAAILPNAPQ